MNSNTLHTPPTRIVPGRPFAVGRTAGMRSPGSAALAVALAVAIGGASRGAEVTAAPGTLNPFGQTDATLRALAENQRRQVEASVAWTTFHDFRFSDHRTASGIRFRQRPVDDGAKDYKAVHYDHGNGMAVADVDGDGRTDVYFVNQIGGNQLWRNLGDGRFEDITAAAGVGMPGKVGAGASFADMDNDGLPDLLVTTVRMGNVLFRNRGKGVFVDATAESGLATARPAHSSGAVFFDFDRDGLLDLFIANVGVYTRAEKGRGGFYLGRSDAFQGWRFPRREEPSVLYRNLGNGRFKDVSREMGLEHRGWSGDATTCDPNADGYPDLYVLSMSGEDRFYENLRGQGFAERTAAYFPKTPWGAMGVKFFDMNLDGRMDLYLTDMHSDMTGAQTKAGGGDFSPAFEKQKSDPWCSIEWTPADQAKAANCILGNAFYRNEGGGRFVEISERVGAETYWPWGISVADFNADGYEDVFVTAGMGYPLRYAANSLLLNEGGARFVDAEYVVGLEPRPASEIEQEFFTLDCSGEDSRHPLCRDREGTWRVIGTASSRSSAAFDFDGDGDVDLVTNEWNDAPRVWRNDRSEKPGFRYLEVQLIGSRSNRDGLGSTVKVRCGDTTLTRFHDGKSGYLSQSALPLAFGLGRFPKVESIEVTWASGRTQVVTGPIPENSRIRITEDR
ncbi:MAG: CRTAC1 family protein [Limisphaerales bacterium]